MTAALSMTELKRMSLSELHRELRLKRIEAAKMRLGLVIQQEKNSASYRVHRRDIARLCTVIAALERGGMKTAQKASQHVSGTPPPETKKLKEMASQKQKKTVQRTKAA